MQSRSGKYQNKKRKTGPQLKKGDKVYLFIKNLKTRILSKKLDYIKVGLFFIKKVKGLVNYKLELLKNVKVYPVFYISLLEPADPSTPLQRTFNYETQETLRTFGTKVKKAEDSITSLTGT